MLVFSAICPHPPILIPSIGKESLDQIANTKKAMEKLERELYASQPDILIVVSPHGEMQSDAFTINVSQKFNVNFEDFGDFATKLELLGELDLITTQKSVIDQKIPINIISEPTLDHGTSVPIFYLTKNLPQTKILPIYFTLFDNQTHFEFGKILKEIISTTNERIAVVASGDLSHCLTKNAPLPFNEKGKEFDETLIKLIKNRDAQKTINLDPQLIEGAGECGLKSILILLGILNNVNYNPEILSYEAPFGVGYLVTNLKLE